MPRDLKAHENQKRARARREGALARREFAYPSVPRSAAAGPTSPAVKIVDPESAAAIAAFMNKRVTT
jgi:hypothetical protein